MYISFNENKCASYVVALGSKESVTDYAADNRLRCAAALAMRLQTRFKICGAIQILTALSIFWPCSLGTDTYVRD